MHFFFNIICINPLSPYMYMYCRYIPATYQIELRAIFLQGYVLDCIWCVEGGRVHVAMERQMGKEHVIMTISYSKRGNVFLCYMILMIKNEWPMIV